MTTATKKRKSGNDFADGRELVGEKMREQEDFRRRAKEEAVRQVLADREIARGVLRELAANITEKKKMPTCEAVAKLVWLEHRLTQTETMNTPLWCKGCSPEFPGDPWMVFECADHAVEQLERSARSWCASLFGGPFA